jgi:hypothetical protein
LAQELYLGAGEMNPEQGHSRNADLGQAHDAPGTLHQRESLLQAGRDVVNGGDRVSSRIVAFLWKKAFHRRQVDTNRGVTARRGLTRVKSTPVPQKPPDATMRALTPAAPLTPVAP